jgi:allophanate hydrolase subunit 2
MLDPFVTGTLTMDIGRIHFAGIGVTPTGTMDAGFFWDAYM